MKEKIVTLLLIFVIAATAVTVYQNMTVKITRYDVMSPEVPRAFDGYKILQLSDLHSAQFGTDNKILIDKIDEASADIILVTGDVFNSYGSDDGSVFLSVAQKLAEKYPVYYIMGNHELRIRETDAQRAADYEKAIQESGVTVLHDSSVKITKNNQSISLYAYDLPLMYYSNRNELKKSNVDLTAEDISRAIPRGEGFIVLMAHNPDYADVYERWGADAVFCGHIHGGVIQLPFVGGIFSPDFTLFPKYDKGLYEVEDMKLIVSAGLGNSIIPFRLFNPPELVVATMRSQ